jgi:predicted ArsR family transcriptional regulator
MSKTTLDRRFFESTRGKIVLLLRSSGKTVNELAAALDLTDNAVRAHLLSLERDGLVTTGGMQKGFRKPHSLFRLTDEARHIFPKFYDSLFNLLVKVLKTRMPAALGTIFQDVGKAAAAKMPDMPDATLEARVAEALVALEGLGGAAVSEQHNGGITIKSEVCPFADAVLEHPEVCKIAESLVSEIVQAPVTEICDRTSLPRCRFAVETLA